MKEEKSKSLDLLAADKIMSKQLAKIVLNTELANKVMAGECKTLTEADEVLDQLSDLAYYVTRLKVYALENKAFGFLLFPVYWMLVTSLKNGCQMSCILELLLKEKKSMTTVLDSSLA